MKQRVWIAVGMVAVWWGMGVMPDAAEAGILLANTTTGVFQFQTGGPNDGANLGSFITGGVGGTFRRIEFGPERNLYVSTDSASVKVFSGVTGAFIGIIPGTTATGQRQIEYDPVSGDLYVGSWGDKKVVRYTSEGFDNPAMGKDDADFVINTNASNPNLFAVVVGPDGKVYTHFVNTLRRYDTDGVFEEGVTLTTNVISAAKFGPDVTGDGLPELYLVNAGTTGGVIKTVHVFDVLSDPANWTELSTVGSGLFTTPIDVAFEGNYMYVSDNGAGIIHRYQWTGLNWIDAPAPGKTGSIFVSGLAGVQGLVFVIPEPATATLLLLSCAALLARPKSIPR